MVKDSYPKKVRSKKFYWCCGVGGCNIEHKSKENAVNCPNKIVHSKELQSSILERYKKRTEKGFLVARLKNEGLTYKQIGKELGLSGTRIREIYIRHKKGVDRELDYSEIVEHSEPLKMSDIFQFLSARSVNCIVNMGKKDVLVSEFLDLPREDILKQKNFGKRSLEEICEIAVALNQVG